MEQYNNILIIKMSSLGDVLHALPTLYALRQNQPNARIVWAVHEEFAALLPAAPYIDEVIRIDKKKLKRLSYWRKLRSILHPYHFDISIDLQGLAKSAVVAFNSGAGKKVGYWEMREGSFLVSKGLAGPHKKGHVIERYLDVVRCLGGTVEAVEFPLPSIEQERARMREALRMRTGGKPYIAVVPGARWAVKEWPLAYWQVFVRRVTDSGMRVVLLGGRDDVPKGRVIEESAASPLLFNYTGRTTLKELTALIADAVLYISADTGPLHLANALKKELIALFGPTSPERTGPYGGKEAAYIHLLVSPTSVATADRPLVDDPDCMARITVNSVWQTYASIMEKTRK